MVAEEPVEPQLLAQVLEMSPGRVDELRQHVQETARSFGQKCIYFERAGEADFVWDPAHEPS